MVLGYLGNYKNELKEKDKMKNEKWKGVIRELNPGPRAP
jgi:hypothetical protein